jgi:cell wall assembly regulator SMI1
VSAVVDAAGMLDGLARGFLGGLRRPGVLQILYSGRMGEVKEFDADGTPIHGMLPGSLPISQLDPLRRMTGAPVVVLEVRLSDTGEYAVGFSADLDSLSPARAVFDRSFRLPGNPPPGGPRTPAPTVGATDPDTVEAVGRLVAEYTGLYTGIMGDAPRFGPAYTEDAIAEAEAEIGLRLPADLRALYRTIGNDSDECGLLGNYYLMPLDRVVADYFRGSPGVSAGLHDLPLIEAGVVFESDPRVRKVASNDRWVTVASDNAGNQLAVDLDPTEAGTAGQLIEYGRDVGDPVHYVAASVRERLGQVVAALRAGAGERGPDENDARLWLSPGVGPRFDFDAHVWSVALGDRDLAAALSEVDDPLAIQAAYLNDASDLDLAGLAPLRNLRSLSINRAGAVRVGLPADLPVESLSLDATNADLLSLTGLDTLWDLTVRGLTDPVDVRGLTRQPSLVRLDLSEVPTDHTADLARCANLRVLTLSRAQWGELRRADRLPARLAVASLSGFTPLSDAVRWANAIALKLGAPPVQAAFTGTPSPAD